MCSKQGRSIHQINTQLYFDLTKDDAIFIYRNGSTCRIEAYQLKCRKHSITVNIASAFCLIEVELSINLVYILRPCFGHMPRP